MKTKIENQEVKDFSAVETDDFFDAIIEEQKEGMSPDETKTTDDDEKPTGKTKKKTEEKKPEDKTDTPIDDEDDKEKDIQKDDVEKKDKEVKKPEDKKPEKKQDEDDIFFVPDIEKEKSAPKIDYKSIAKKFEIDFEDPEEEVDQDQFVDAIKKKIEDSKSLTQLDLSKYNDEQKELIKVLEISGNQYSFMDPISDLNDYLLLSDAKKLAVYLKFEKKMTDSQIQDETDRLVESGEFDSEVEKINSLIDDQKKLIMKEVFEKAKKRAESLQSKAKKENEELNAQIEKTTHFMGEKLPDNAKSYIKHLIKDGQFTKKLDNAESLINAQLFNLFGNKIIQKMKTQIDEAKRQGFITGRKKENDKLHDKEGSGNSRNLQDTGRKSHDDMSSDDPLAGFNELIQEIPGNNF